MICPEKPADLVKSKSNFGVHPVGRNIHEPGREARDQVFKRYTILQHLLAFLQLSSLFGDHLLEFVPMPFQLCQKIFAFASLNQGKQVFLDELPELVH